LSLLRQRHEGLEEKLEALERFRHGFPGLGALPDVKLVLSDVPRMDVMLVEPDLDRRGRRDHDPALADLAGGGAGDHVEALRDFSRRPGMVMRHERKRLAGRHVPVHRDDAATAICGSGDEDHARPRYRIVDLVPAADHARPPRTCYRVERRYASVTAATCPPAWGRRAGCR